VQLDHKQGEGEGFVNLKWASSSNALVNWSRQTGVTATQSSTAFGGVASRAIDGDTSGDYGSGSITHTDGTQSENNWWSLDLKTDRIIDRIQIYNRNLDNDVITLRLSNFRVTVVNKAGEVTFTKDFYTEGISSVEAVEYIETNGIVGSSVKIELLGTSTEGHNVLSLAEVEVLGRTDSAELYTPISNVDSLPVEPFQEDGRDQDLDGIEDTWEVKHGFNPSVFETGVYAPYADDDKDGYINSLESGRNSQVHIEI